MTLPLPELLRVVAKHGCAMRLEGETVRVRSPTLLPEPILAELRARKGEVVEFLSRQGVRHIPDDWRDGARLLAGGRAPLDWPASAWERLQSALPAFMAAWAPQAAALGWGRSTCSVAIHRRLLPGSMPKGSSSGSTNSRCWRFRSGAPP